MSHSTRTEHHLQLAQLSRDSVDLNKRRIAAEILEKLGAFLQAKPIAVGELRNSQLCMPLSSTKGTCLTWHRVLARLVTDLGNSPSSNDACWLIPASKSGTDSSGYHLFRVGNMTRFRTHRVLHAIYNPQFYETVNNRALDQHLAHSCGFGRAYRNTQSQLICINPHHLAYCTSLVNQDHKGCKYGCAQLCPHDGFCRWNWPDTTHLSCQPCVLALGSVSTSLLVLLL